MAVYGYALAVLIGDKVAARQRHRCFPRPASHDGQDQVFPSPPPNPGGDGTVLWCMVPTTRRL
jgi:hypothetical protein